jgi:hypothetical protein
VVTLAVAWINFLSASRWAEVPGALRGWREPWYALALATATVLAFAARRHVGQPIRLPPAATFVLLVSGTVLLATAFFGRLPVSTWGQIPFKDDWTELFQQASNGVALLRRGVVVGWNWWFLGGYPTSTDIAQNFGTVAFVPMTVFGDRLGYHILHAVLFFAVPAFVWIDLRREARDVRLIATGLACCFAGGYSGALGSSGDTNSLVGVCCCALAVSGGHAARLGSRWGGPALFLGLTLALYTHTAFAIYGGIYLLIEAIYYRDRGAVLRLAAASALALVAALPTHWESFRYPAYVSFNNTVYAPGAPTNWASLVRNLYYNVEILFLPHRWFNDYRSLANIWLPVLLVTGLLPGRSRTSFFAWTAVVTQLLLRVNTPEAGAVFDRIQHMLPMLTAPALAGFVVRCGGRRRAARGARPLRADRACRRPSRTHTPRVRSTAHGPDRGRRRHGARRSQPAPRHGRRSDPTDAHHAVRRPFRRLATQPGRTALLQSDDRRVGLECFPGTGRGRGHVRRTSCRGDAARDVRCRNGAVGRAAPVRVDGRVTRVPPREWAVRGALAWRALVTFRTPRDRRARGRHD